jgi:hypothetical protein
MAGASAQQQGRSPAAGRGACSSAPTWLNSSSRMRSCSSRGSTSGVGMAHMAQASPAGAGGGACVLVEGSSRGRAAETAAPGCACLASLTPLGMQGEGGVRGWPSTSWLQQAAGAAGGSRRPPSPPGMWLSSSVTSSRRLPALLEGAVLSELAGRLRLRAAASSLVLRASLPADSASSSVPRWYSPAVTSMVPLLQEGGWGGGGAVPHGVAQGADACPPAQLQHACRTGQSARPEPLTTQQHTHPPTHLLISPACPPACPHPHAAPPTPPHKLQLLAPTRAHLLMSTGLTAPAA